MIFKTRLLASMWLQAVMNAWWNAWLDLWDWVGEMADRPEDKFEDGYDYDHGGGFDPSGDFL